MFPCASTLTVMLTTHHFSVSQHKAIRRGGTPFRRGFRRSDLACAETSCRKYLPLLDTNFVEVSPISRNPLSAAVFCPRSLVVIDDSFSAQVILSTQ